jgi:hypothetical protein
MSENENKRTVVVIVLRSSDDAPNVLEGILAALAEEAHTPGQQRSSQNGDDDDNDTNAG